MLRRDRQLLTQIYQLKDAALFVLALWIAYEVRAEWFTNWFPKKVEIEPFSQFAWLLLLIIPGAPFILETQGFYQRSAPPPRAKTIWMLAKGCLLITFGIILLMFFFKWTLARAVILLFGAISFVLLLLNEEIMRALYSSRYAQRQFRKRVLLAGSPQDTLRMKADLKNMGNDMDVVGELDINESGLKELMVMLHKQSPNNVLINARHTYFGQVEKAILACEREGIEAWLVADFFKTQISRTTIDHLQAG